MTSKRVIPVVFSVLAVMTAIYHIVTTWLGTPTALFQRPMHLMLLSILLFHGFRARPDEDDGLNIVDWAWIALTVVVGVFTISQTDTFLTRIPYITPMTNWEMAAAVATIFIVLEGARRTSGWSLPICAAVFVAYAIWGRMLPDSISHRGVDFETLLEVLYLSTDGIWGTAMDASATFIIMFSIFAAFLLNSGVGAFFNDLAMSMTGKAKGGPAKMAVIGSYFMGMISGASTTNVVTVGSFTIPLMKRAGYPAVFAAAVEAAASTGGQIMPPIMGVAAFLMVQFTGIGYVDIMKHAALPGSLFFFSIYMMVHFRASRFEHLGAGWVPDVQVSSWALIRKRGYLAAPILVMVFMLIQGYTPQMTALVSAISVYLLSWLSKDTRMGWDKVVKSLDQGVRWMIPVAAACAAAGIIEGIVQITGLSVKLANIVMLLSGGHVWIALILTMIVAIILGTGLPSSGAYIIMATLLAPALVKMDISVIATHMFIFYFACMSSITPPVALASYAAAGIAGANPTTVSNQAFLLVTASYIVPFMFVYDPALLWIGSWQDIAVTAASSFFGVVAIAGALEGYFYTPAPRIWQRAFLLLGGGLMISPALLADVVGVALCAVVYFQSLWSVSRKGGAPLLATGTEVAPAQPLPPST